MSSSSGTQRWSVRDLDIRAQLITKAIEEPLHEELEGSPAASTRARAKLLAQFNRISEDERLYAIGYCESATAIMLATRAMPQQLACRDLPKFLDEEMSSMPEH